MNKSTVFTALGSIFLISISFWHNWLIAIGIGLLATFFQYTGTTLNNIEERVFNPIFAVPLLAGSSLLIALGIMLQRMTPLIEHVTSPGTGRSISSAMALLLLWSIVFVFEAFTPIIIGWISVMMHRRKNKPPKLKEEEV